jgi:hypothetical protein
MDNHDKTNHISRYQQMKKSIVIILILISNLTFSQNNKIETEFRKVSGIIKGYDIPKDGILVSYVGINRAVITDSNGNFCLTVPNNKSVFIEVPICGALTMQEIKTTDINIIFEVTSADEKTEYAKESEQNWNRIKEELQPELMEIYESAEYKKAEDNICW